MRFFRMILLKLHFYLRALQHFRHTRFSYCNTCLISVCKVWPGFCEMTIKLRKMRGFFEMRILPSPDSNTAVLP